MDITIVVKIVFWTLGVQDPMIQTDLKDPHPK